MTSGEVVKRSDRDAAVGTRAIDRRTRSVSRLVRPHARSTVGRFVAEESERSNVRLFRWVPV